MNLRVVALSGLLSAAGCADEGLYDRWYGKQATGMKELVESRFGPECGNKKNCIISRREIEWLLNDFTKNNTIFLNNAKGLPGFCVADENIPMDTWILPTYGAAADSPGKATSTVQLLPSVDLPANGELSFQMEGYLGMKSGEASIVVSGAPVLEIKSVRIGNASKPFTLERKLTAATGKPVEIKLEFEALEPGKLTCLRITAIRFIAERPAPTVAEK